MTNANKANNMPILEVLTRTVSQIDKRFTQADFGRTAIQLMAGSRAFRDYNWLTQVRPTNISANYRGMVVNAKWATAFRFINQYHGSLDNLSYLAGWFANLAEAEPKMEAVFGSNDSSQTKALRIATIAGTAAQRTLLGVIPAGTHLIYRSLEGWCMIAGMAGGPFQSRSAIKIIDSADVLVQSTFTTVTDTQNQGKVIWSVIDTVLSSRTRPAMEIGVWKPLVERY